MGVVGRAATWIRRRWVRIALIGGLPVLAIVGWRSYYRHYDRVCYAGKAIAGCGRFIPMERFACDNGVGDSRLVGGCSHLAARYDLGVGVRKDPAQAIAFWRRGCVLGDARSCLLAGEDYMNAFTKPHWTIAWSGSYDEATYRPNYARELDDVLADAERLCATDFVGTGCANNACDPSREQLLRGICDDLPGARAARDDARSNVPELVALCSDSNMPACHLAGLTLTFGIGTKRDMVRGKTFLKRACDHNVLLDACYQAGLEKGQPSVMLNELEAAVAPAGG
jgi:TPR repeat protein